MRTYAKLTFLIALFFAASATSLLAQEREFGKVSYYSDSFQGSATASGVPYDKDKLTGAHKTLPFGTKVKITRLDNKKSVTVTINDRGPFIKGRIVEVSKKAAQKIGLTIDGVTEVTLDVLTKGGSKAIAKIPDNIPDEYDAVIKKDTKAVKEKVKTSKARANDSKAKTSTASKDKVKTVTKTDSKNAVLTAKGDNAKKAAPPTMALRKDKNFNAYDLYKISLVRPVKQGFGVQVAFMTDYENTMKKVAELEGQWFQNILLSIEEGDDGDPVYKIILGYFDTQEKATAYKKDLKKNKKIDGFVVDLEGMK